MGADMTGRYRNRFEEAMIHSSRYAFAGKARLARDCGLSKMAIIRLLSGDTNPSYRVVSLVVTALEKALGCHLDVRDLMSYGGGGWERSICEVCGCGGCLPDGALRDDGTLDPVYENVAPGTWKAFQPLSATPTQQVGEERTLYRKEER